MNNSKNNINIQKLLNNSIKYRIKDKVINYAALRAKDHFGYCDTLYGAIAQNKVIEFIKSNNLDSNFKKHFICKNGVTRCICENLPLLYHIDKATFMYVVFMIGTEEVECGVKFYIFGKKMNKYAKMIKKKLYFNNNKNIMHNVKRIYNVTASDDNWSSVVNTIDSRGFDTLYLDNCIDIKIKEYLDTWLKNKHIYEERGLLFKTGILLYGNPGTGKTTIATAIATYLKCDIINIDMSTFKNLDVGSLVNSINADNDMYVILLDEIDILFKSREDEDISIADKQIISKLLTLLDSINSPNNCIFVATTNYIDKLDNAVVRKGRFDKQYEVTNISRESAYRMCKSFKLSEESINKVLNDKTFPTNPAALQTDILEEIKYTISNS